MCGAGRALGYVCAPSLFQFLVGRCADLTSDMSFYRTNRDLLYNGLTEMGYSCVKPDGAFYLFVKSPEKMCIRDRGQPPRSPGNPGLGADLGPGGVFRRRGHGA